MTNELEKIEGSTLDGNLTPENVDVLKHTDICDKCERLRRQ